MLRSVMERVRNEALCFRREKGGCVACQWNRHPYSFEDFPRKKFDRPMKAFYVLITHSCICGGIGSAV